MTDLNLTPEMPASEASQPSEAPFTQPAEVTEPLPVEPSAGEAPFSSVPETLQAVVEETPAPAEESMPGFEAGAASQPVVEPSIPGPIPAETWIPEAPAAEPVPAQPPISEPAAAVGAAAAFAAAASNPPPAPEPPPAAAYVPPAQPPAWAPPPQTPPPYAYPPAAPATSAGPTSDERTWASIAHLTILINLFTGVIGPLAALVIYLIYRDKSRYIAYHAMQSFLLQLLGWIGAGALAAVLWVITVPLLIVLVGFCLIPFDIFVSLIPLASLVYGVIAAIKTSQGEDFRYWLVGDWTRGTLTDK